MFLNFVFSTSHELFLRAKIYQITVDTYDDTYDLSPIVLKTVPA